MVYYPFATEEQKDLAAGAAQIVAEQLKPNLEEYEHGSDGLGEYPMEVHKALADAGYYGMNIPEAYGGLDLDIVTRVMITEQIAAVDAGFAFSFTCSGNYCRGKQIGFLSYLTFPFISLQTLLFQRVWRFSPSFCFARSSHKSP